MKQDEVLKQRAKVLAKPHQKDDFKDEYLEILIFKMANEKYGIETKYAREVYPLKDYTLLPCSPAYIFGLINVRRKILTVIDLKVLFGLKGESSESSKIIIIQRNEKEFGLLTDGFEGIEKIPLNKIQLTLPTLTGIRQDLTKGVTLEKIIILDGNKLLSCKQIICEEMVEI
jgi:purine-binding chemotaxis protein CheW